LDNGTSAGGETAGGAPVTVKPSPVAAMRRESFLYRSDSDFDMSPKSLSRASSLNANDTSVDIMKSFYRPTALAAVKKWTASKHVKVEGCQKGIKPILAGHPCTVTKKQ